MNIDAREYVKSRPILLPAHNLTINVTDAECHETEESACEYGEHEEQVYMVGRLDVGFFLMMVAACFVLHDLVSACLAVEDHGCSPSFSACVC